MENLKQSVTFNKEDNFATLDLSRQNLEKIPKEIKEISQYMFDEYGEDAYREINLSYNNLKSISENDLDNLNGFDVIHLVGLKMNKLPPEITRLDNPIMLNFSYSDLVELPKEIYELEQLVSIRINWTSIKNFHVDIAKLENLTDVEVSETPFMNMIYKIQENKGIPVNESENEVWKVKSILDDLGCEIIE